MDTQISFIRETRRLEKEYTNVRKQFLIFANQKVAKADISDTEKFRLLSAFLGDYASETAVVSGHCYVTMDLPDHLMQLHDSIEKDFDLEAKLDGIAQEQDANHKAWREWEKANSPKSPLLPY